MLRKGKVRGCQSGVFVWLKTTFSSSFLPHFIFILFYSHVFIYLFIEGVGEVLL